MPAQRRIRKRRVYPAQPPLSRRIAAFAVTLAPEMRVGLRLLISGVVIVHFILFVIFPGGRNGLTGSDATGALPQLTYFPVSDAFGFPGGQLEKGFIRYRTYNQDGTESHGYLPDPGIRPGLRFERWTAAGDAMSGADPANDEFLLDFILSYLPETPVKIELYAVSWSDGKPYPPPPADAEKPALYRIFKLGSHDGLTQVWRPVKERKLK